MLFELLQRDKHSDLVLIADDFNTHLHSLNQFGGHLGGCFGVSAQRTNNGDSLLQLCSDNRVFLESTEFKHSVEISNMVTSYTYSAVGSNVPCYHQSPLEGLGSRLPIFLEYIIMT